MYFLLFLHYSPTNLTLSQQTPILVILTSRISSFILHMNLTLLLPFLLLHPYLTKLQTYQCPKKSSRCFLGFLFTYSPPPLHFITLCANHSQKVNPTNKYLTPKHSQLSERVVSYLKFSPPCFVIAEPQSSTRTARLT
jgi:hypothetical protein